MGSPATGLTLRLSAPGIAKLRRERATVASKAEGAEEAEKPRHVMTAAPKATVTIRERKAIDTAFGILIGEVPVTTLKLTSVQGRQEYVNLIDSRFW